LEHTVQGRIVVGFDGSPESRAAADWAARESLRRGLPLELVQAWPWHGHHVLGGDDVVRWGKERLTNAESALRERLSGTEVTAVHVPGAPAEVLEAAGKEATMLVLGSRGIGTVRGFVVGSVSQEVLTRASCPVVLVRARDTAAQEHEPTADVRPPTDRPHREVALGLDLGHPCDPVIGFAFEAAALRSAPLRVVHAWTPSLVGEYLVLGASAGLEAPLELAQKEALSGALRPWQERYPQVEVVPVTVLGNTAPALLETAARAGLLVVGRRNRRAPIGPHIGPVAHAAIHHASCPVAVVPHG
jgi:nucleotide-binding universal stress UspA family protein